ncbi:MAG: ROK family transcriptional regulator [Lentisphaerae bacterium]|nr:ROK family transcriptional regulator [Lentisphaerota bacterium]
MDTRATLSILSALRRAPGLTRGELAARTGLHSNSVARTVTRLIRQGVVRERPPSRSVRRGRPQIPLELDTQRACVGGLAIGQGAVEAIHLDLMGQPVRSAQRHIITDAGSLPRVLPALMRDVMRSAPLAVGVCVTGFVEPHTKRILFSSALPQREVSLAATLRRCGTTPVVLNSEVHALSARWLMNHGEAQAEDVLVVTIEDGAVGASLLVAGRPNPGCMLGGNELGHMRLAVETTRCYCGGVGCVERVFSTACLRALDGPSAATLATALATPRLSSGARRIIELTAQAIANVTIFARPHRVVLAGSLTARPGFQRHMDRAWRQALPAIFERRVRLDWWPIQATISAETAGWLAIARVMQGP